jgi:hypothetical protein
MWLRQWVDALDGFETNSEETYRLIQNRGRGLAITGTREWTDYSLNAVITPHLARALGLAVRVQGLERYYALLLCERGTVKLVKRLDGEEVLGEQRLAWEFGCSYDLRIVVRGDKFQAWVDGSLIFDLEDTNRPLKCGGIALVCEGGRVGVNQVSVNSP